MHQHAYAAQCAAEEMRCTGAQSGPNAKLTLFGVTVPRFAPPQPVLSPAAA